MKRQPFPSLVSFAGLIFGLCLSSATLAVEKEPFDLSPEQPGRPVAAVNEVAIRALPENLKLASTGTLTVATYLGSAPLGTYATDDSTPIGSDPEIARLVAESLGLKLNLVPVAWSDWPLGLASGKYDAVISNITITEERKKRYDFSSYRTSVNGFYVANSSSIQSIKEPKDIAGLRIVTDSGTIQERTLLEWSRVNEATGLAATQLLYFDDEAASDLALNSGRADAIFNPDATQYYQSLKKANKRRVGLVNTGWPETADVGIATKKGSGLAEPIALAIDGIIASGQYSKSLQRWNLQAESVDQAQVNPPGLREF